MEYVIADIRISLPEELIPRRFAEALRPFAVAEPIGRARAAGPEVAPREDAGRARSASPEVAPRECKGVMPELIPGAVTRIHPAPGWQELHRFEFPDAGADCRFGRDNAGFLLEMVPRDGTPAARFRTSETGDRTSCDFSIHHHPALFRFGVWMLFNLAALRRNAIAIHASAIRYRDAGLLFLGEMRSASGDPRGAARPPATAMNPHPWPPSCGLCRRPKTGFGGLLRSKRSGLSFLRSLRPSFAARSSAKASAKHSHR